MTWRKKSKYDIYTRKSTSNFSKCNCDPVIYKARHLWRKGASKKEIASDLNVSLSTVDRMTKNWTPYSSDTTFNNKKTKFDYNVAYCLVYGHGLTLKEAAFALSVDQALLRNALSRNKEKIEAGYEQWIKDYSKDYYKNFPKILHDTKSAARLRYQKAKETNSFHPLIKTLQAAE